MLKRFAITLAWVAATFLGSLCIIVLGIFLSVYALGMQGGAGIDNTFTQHIIYWVLRRIFVAPTIAAVITLLAIVKGMHLTALKKFAITLVWVAATFLGSLCILILLLFLSAFAISMQGGAGIDATFPHRIVYWVLRRIFVAPMIVAVITPFLCMRGKLPGTGLGKSLKADNQEKSVNQ